MNDLNTAKRFFTRQFHARWRHLAAVGAPLVLVLGLSQPALAQDPIITLHPTNQTVCEGGNVTMSVQATSTKLPMTFQWQRDDTAAPMTFTNIPNAIGGRLSLRSVTPNDTGDYRVIVANAAGDSITSEVAHLEVMAEVTVAPFRQVNPDELGDAGFLGQGYPYWIDMNQDGWLDVLLARDLTAPLAYEGKRDGTFVGITNNLTQLTKRWYSGAYWCDIDDDGDLDSLLADIGGQHTLFVSQASAGTPDYVVRQQQWTPGLYGSFVDYDNDGWADLAMTHWWSYGGSWGLGFLARNQGGQFGIVNSTGFEINEGIEWHSWIDYDEDGDLDFFGATSGDSPKDVLLANQGNGRFVRITNHVLVNQNTQNIMSAWGDYDNDGDLDVFLPYFYTPSMLYRNLGGGQFEADPTAPTLNQGTPLFSTWGDYDNDGDLDLIVTHNFGLCRLFNNDGAGKLTEISARSMFAPTSGMYFAWWADYDNDGYLDLLVGPRISGVPVESVLYANQLPANGEANHWLKVTLKGKVSNPNGFGAKVRVQAEIGGKTVGQMRQLGIMGGLCSSDFTAHFGLGDAATIDTLRIEWPSGIVQELKDVAVNQQLEVVESQGVAMTEPLVIQDYNPRSTTVSCPVDGVRCVLETSVDLEHWSKVKVQTSAGGTVKFAYVDVSRAPTRFYRVLVP
jgi:hypothetical protein